MRAAGGGTRPDLAQEIAAPRLGVQDVGGAWAALRISATGRSAARQRRRSSPRSSLDSTAKAAARQGRSCGALLGCLIRGGLLIHLIRGSGHGCFFSVLFGGYSASARLASSSSTLM